MLNKIKAHFTSIPQVYLRVQCLPYWLALRTCFLFPKVLFDSTILRQYLTSRGHSINTYYY